MHKLEISAKMEESMSATQDIELLLTQIKEEKSREKLEQAMEILNEMDILMPAVFSSNTDPAIIKQAIASVGKKEGLPKGAVPKPAILENTDGKKFLPVFTCKEEVDKAKAKIPHPFTLGLPFKSAMELLQKEMGLDGIVINPFGQNLVLNKNTNQQKEQQTVTMNEQQLHAFMRQRYESHDLPLLIFAQKEDILNRISQEEGACLLEQYHKTYEQTKNCPYTEADFDVMTLQIKEDLVIIRITMPTTYLTPGTCPTIMIAWSPQRQFIRYFAVVTAPDHQQPHLIEVKPEGNNTDHGEAPNEGVELQYIMDLVQ